MRRGIIALITGSVVLVGGMLQASAASALDAPDEIGAPAVIESMLAAVPGGVLIDETRAVWPTLGMELVVAEGAPTSRAAVAAAAVGLCPSGRVCAFDQTATAGARLSWTSCDASFPVGTFTVRSIADARSSGYAQARYGTTVRATASAGNWANVYGTVSRIVCVS